MKVWGWIVVLLGIIALGLGGFLAYLTTTPDAPAFDTPLLVQSPSPLPFLSPHLTLQPSPTPLPLSTKILIDVPFMVQAPFGRWDTSLFQDGCEEVSLLMAWHWLQGTTLTEAQVAQEITKLSAFEDKKYGSAVDRSAADTAKLMQDYFGYTKIRVAYDVTAPDIIAELQQGNIVITPMDGRALNNPFYTPPGPERHMLVIRGYDPTTKEFITNDGGTKRGAGYRYGQQRLLSAIRDYPTGNHQPITTKKTAMIVVGK